jgi:hypothetical protein
MQCLPTSSRISGISSIDRNCRNPHLIVKGAARTPFPDTVFLINQLLNPEGRKESGLQL